MLNGDASDYQQQQRVRGRRVNRAVVRRFQDFGRVALVVTLDCGEENFMDTCKLFKRLPRGACYTARLLKSPRSILEGLEAKGHDVWIEA